LIFSTDITIPKNTTEASPKEVRLGIAKGIITEWRIQIPAGHAGLAHLAIYHGATRIVPSTENMSIHGDDILLEWTDYYEYYEPPYELKLLGWNEDDTYEHSFIVYCIVLPRRATGAPAVSDALKIALGSILPKRLVLGGK